jgi:hypothetical protein
VAATAAPPCVRRLHTDWSVWWIGSRTQWNVTRDFYIGLDVIYQKIEGMSFANVPADGFTFANTSRLSPASRTTSASGSALTATSILDQLIG